MSKREILGHIPCPVCESEMRVTKDKNGAPFGYCESNCNAQLRVGGSAHRVAAFVKRYPWAGAPVTAPDTAPPAEKKPAAPPVTAPAPVTKAAPKRGPLDDFFKRGAV